MGVGGHKRLLVMLGFVLCLCGFARPALAAPKVGKVVNGSGDSATVDVQVIGSGISNGFSAAAWSFGVDPSSLTAEQKTKLSNESTGGAFYRYAMAFQSGAHEPLTVGLSSWYAVTLPQFVWTVEGYPYGDYAQARRDLKTIRDGGDLGGGGGSSSGRPERLSFSDGFVRYLNGTSAYGNRVMKITDGATTISNLVTSSGTARDDALFANRIDVVWEINGYIDWSSLPDDVDYENFYIVFYTRSSNLSSDRPYIAELYYVPDSTSTVTVGSTSFGSLQCNYLDRIVFSGVYYKLISILCNVTYNNGSFTITQPVPATSPHVFSQSSNSSGISVSGYACAAGSSHASVGPTLPPVNNWPVDESPNTDPPEVPGPSDDPIPQPDPPDLPNPVDYPVSDPYTPDPDPPTNPIITYDPDPTGDALDYRPWLNAILKLLRTINTSINDGFYNMDVWLTEHCDHIREMMHKEALALGLKMQAAINNGFVSFERWLQSTYGPYFFEELDATLRAILADYEDYLYDLFVWLSEQFDFSVSGGSGSYDDSTLLYWLQQIWAILAEKPSVGTEPDSFFDWLANLLAGILGGLVAWLLGALGGMADAVSGLATKFPFSLPWDIATMLALFVHEPVTPVFDLPFALPGEYANVRVDMSYFDEVMAAVRGVELVLFGLALAKRTPDMLELADTVFS